MDLLREAGLAVRRLARAPGYTTAALLSLSLAIGANSAIFSAVNAVVLRPLPIREPDRLLTCWETDPQGNLAIVEVSYRNFRDWQSESRAFAGLAALSGSNWSTVWEGPGDPVRLQYTAVSATFFEVLGATASLGRTFRPADDQPGAERVALLSHGTWQRHFGADSAVVGRMVILDKRPHRVVGVMPPDFEYPTGAEFWTPLLPVLEDAARLWKMDTLENRGLGLLYVVGRLEPGVSPEQAEDDLERVVANLWSAAPRARPQGHGVVVSPFLDQLFGPVRQVLLWLFGAVGLILCIGCANVSGLMLTRATETRRSDAVRLALGATRGRLIGGWLLEAGWLVLFGGLAGLAGARWLTGAIVALAPAGIPRLAGLSVDGSVVAFTLGVCALAMFACALAPAWRSALTDVAPALGDAARSTSGRLPLRTRSALVVFEIALAVALLIAGSLVATSFANLRRLDLGYQPANVLTIDVDPRGAGDVRQFHRELLARIAGLPGVEEAGAVYLRPLALGPIGQEAPILLEGQTEDGEDASRNPYVNYESATPGYFRALRIPLVKGRLFDERDDARAAKVAIVGESTARRLWPGQEPIGQRLSIRMLSSEGVRSVSHEVVGVVKDARYRGLDDVRLDFYEPSEQAFPENIARHLMIRTSGDPLAMAGAVQAQVRALDRSAVVDGVTTLDAIVGRAIAPWRFAVWMFTLFALLAFLLATGGLFSLVALTVAARSREFAVRMALGAQGRDISHRVLIDASRQALLGVGIGLPVAGVGARWLASLLYEVRPLEPAVYAGAVLVVLATTMATSLLPAYRAGRVDPMTLLREE